MSSLVTASWLREALPDVVVIDVSFVLGGPPGRSLYDAGHLPGAYFVDLDTELAAPPGAGGRHPLPSATVVQSALRRCGVSDSSDVVVYDQATSLSAARAWWIFRYFGLPSVRVLDGGLAAWRESGGEVVTAEPPPSAGTFVARPGQLPVLTAADAAELPARGALLDVRTPERYAGENEPIDPVAGHIPGAFNLPAATLQQPDGRFRPAAEIRAELEALGVAGAPEVGAYCGSGITAAQAALALEQAGVDATVYIGSWSDWITDPDRPVATGTTR
jgi:thiosulfate/3-mercaptopyruvate sulfurtransferase